MKLLSEVTEKVETIEVINESTKEKSLYIQGPFIMYDRPNRNNRVYPREIIEKEVSRYVTENVNTKRAFGELNHPTGPNINLDRVSHLIESLTMKNDGSVYGKAKILNTPMGTIVRGLLEGGASLGVSTRGLGSLKPLKDGLSEVQQDFRLVTAADIVADPSAHTAYVQGIMENHEYYFDAVSGTFAEQVIEKQRTEMKKSTTQNIIEQKAKYFNQIIESLSIKK